MHKEIERKFLVASKAYRKQATRTYKIKQGYLSTHKKRTVRVRLQDHKGLLTIKGKSSKSGMSRIEWEKEIDLEEAKALFKMCKKNKIKKTRHIVPVANHIFEVDEFKGKNKGLVLAEIELKTENESFSKPNWLGEEVTQNPKYYNAQLIKNPYNTW